MDEKSQQILTEILTKDPDELTTDQVLFLRARRSYLKQSQVEEYKSVLETKPNLPMETVNKDAKSKK